MTYPIAVLIAIVVGFATGYLAQRVPVAPVLQSAGAAVVGMLLASLAAGMIWLLRPSPDAGVLAVSIGIAEGVLIGLAVAFVAGVIHAILGWAGHAALASHRGILLGLLGALYGAIASMSGFGAVHALK
jgi:hypothetical protein